MSKLFPTVAIFFKWIQQLIVHGYTQVKLFYSVVIIFVFTFCFPFFLSNLSFFLAYKSPNSNDTLIMTVAFLLQIDFLLLLLCEILIIFIPLFYFRSGWRRFLAFVVLNITLLSFFGISGTDKELFYIFLGFINLPLFIIFYFLLDRKQESLKIKNQQFSNLVNTKMNQIEPKQKKYFNWIGVLIVFLIVFGGMLTYGYIAYKKVVASNKNIENYVKNLEKVTTSTDTDFGDVAVESWMDAEQKSVEEEKDNGHKDRIADESDVPHLIYIKDGSLYRTDVKGSFHQNIFTIWEKAEEKIIFNVNFFTRVNKVLIVIKGKKIEDIETVYGHRELSYTEQQEYLKKIQEAEKAQRIILLDLNDNSYIDILPNQKQINPLSPVYYFISNDGKFLYTQEQSRTGYDIYDFEKNEWRTVDEQNILDRCNNYLIKDPWQRDDAWHLISNYNWYYVRIIEDNVVKRCLFEDGSKVEIADLNVICPFDDTLLHLNHSKYNSEYLIYACGAENSLGATNVGIFDLSTNQKLEIASYDNPNGQVSGLYEYGGFLLSPDTKKFIYTYTENKQEDSGAWDLVEYKFKLHFLDSGTIKEFDVLQSPNQYVHLYSTFSPNSDYLILLNQQEDLDEEAWTETITYIWQSYNIATGEIHDVVTMVENIDYNNYSESDEKNYDHAFLGWVQ